MFGFGKKPKFKEEDVTTLIGNMSATMAHCIELMNDDYYEAVRREQVSYVQIAEHLTKCSRQTGEELNRLKEDNRKLQQALEILSEETNNNFLEK